MVASHWRTMGRRVLVVCYRRCWSLERTQLTPRLLEPDLNTCAILSWTTKWQLRRYAGVTRQYPLSTCIPFTRFAQTWICRLCAYFSSPLTPNCPKRKQKWKSRYKSATPLPWLTIPVFARTQLQVDSFSQDSDGMSFIMDNSSTGAFCNERSMFVGKFKWHIITNLKKQIGRTYACNIPRRQW